MTATITTYKLPASNHLPDRIKAIKEPGIQVTLPYHTVEGEDPHTRARDTLASNLGWTVDYWVTGCNHDGTQVHIPIRERYPKTITIVARKMKDEGSTYFSAHVLVNGKHVETVPYSYGYDEAYIFTSFKQLAKLGYLPGFTRNHHGSYPQVYAYCQEHDIHLEAYCSWVRTKKDLLA